jgi:hypothetical protein
MTGIAFGLHVSEIAGRSDGNDERSDLTGTLIEQNPARHVPSM